MARISNRITSGVSTILHSLIVPVFVLVFMTYYKPLGIYELLSMENVTYGFNVTMIFCIVLVTVSITRAWLYLLGKFKKLPVSVYTMWCIGETLIASLFAAMYVTLMSPEQISYFETAGSTFISLLVTTIYPYGFLWLGLELYAKHNDDVKPVDESSLIRFYDEYKKLRLVLASEAIIFIKSEAFAVGSYKHANHIVFVFKNGNISIMIIGIPFLEGNFKNRIQLIDRCSVTVCRIYYPAILRTVVPYAERINFGFFKIYHITVSIIHE